MSALLGALELGTRAASGLTALTPTEYDAEEKRRLEELRRRRLKGQLGLSDAEEQLLYQQYAGQNAAQQDQLQQQRAQQMASGIGMGGGNAMLASIASEEASRRLADEQQRAVTAADIEAKALEEDEYWARLANQAEAKKEKVGALLGVGADMAAGISNMATQSRTLQGVKATPSQIKSFGDELGIDETEAGALFNQLAMSPEARRVLGLIG